MTVRSSLRARLDTGRILLGAHRGNSAEFPENTLAAFSSAIDLGVDLIECDVHLTEDGALAVIHDHLLERTTSGRGLVRDHTMAQLKSLDAGRWKNDRFSGERIPRLEEVLRLAKHRVGVAIEIKSLPFVYTGIEQVVARAVDDAGMTDEVVVIAFDHRCIKHMRRLLPGVLTGVILVGRPVDPLQLLADAEADLFCPEWWTIDPDTARELHEAGKHIGVWTIDDPFSLGWCRALPADAIYTNNPRTIRIEQER